MRPTRGVFGRVWPPIWLGALLCLIAVQLRALVTILPDIPAHPVGATLYATLCWLMVLMLAWNVDSHIRTFDMFLPRPRNLRIVRDGVTLPAHLVDLGRDPFGARSWMITNVAVRFGDELRVDAVPHDAAIYFLNCEGDLVRLGPPPGQDDDDEMS